MIAEYEKLAALGDVREENSKLSQRMSELIAERAATDEEFWAKKEKLLKLGVRQFWNYHD